MACFKKQFKVFLTHARYFEKKGSHDVPQIIALKCMVGELTLSRLSNTAWNN